MIDIINNLKRDYSTLPWYQKLFFPAALARALDTLDESADTSPEQALHIYDAYVNNTWFFQRWFFTCLDVFSKTAFVKGLSTLQTKGLLHGEDAEDNRMTVANASEPDAAALLLAKLHTFKLLTPHTRYTVEKHTFLPALACSFQTLASNSKNPLTSDIALALFNALAEQQNPFDAFELYALLNETTLLTGPERLNNYNALHGKTNLTSLTNNLKAIKKAGFLDGENAQAMFNAVVQNPIFLTEYCASYSLISQIETAGLSQGNKKQINLYALLNHRAPLKITQIMKHLTSSNLIAPGNENNEQSQLKFDQLIAHSDALASDHMMPLWAKVPHSGFTEAQWNKMLVPGSNPVSPLLEFPAVFAHAEIHMHEYGANDVNPFVLEQVRTLREAKTTFEAENPGDIFDITEPQQSKLCYYIIKNLIRRNDPALSSDIEFLITIPSVRELLHLRINPQEHSRRISMRENPPNALIELASSLHNAEAIRILRTVPAVHDLFERTQNQRALAAEAQQNGPNITALANDRESSMTALTSGEKKRLESAANHYQPLIDERGVDALMKELRDTLQSRYEANPATIIQTDGTSLSLPMTWVAFQDLRLNATDQGKALKAYYKHKDHTAYRYVAKPNPWLASNALYIKTNDVQTERWSEFENYQSLIVMLFLAATDKNEPACDGHTRETRLTHFIDELAHIGRAHNWDETREKTINGKQVSEEYDDLEGDKPSCFSGTKRRLFQSVVGHPLFKILSLDNVKEALQAFVRAHFEQCIKQNPDKVAAWNTSWEALYETGIDDEGTLATLNIPEEEQNKFITLFNQDPNFKAYIEKRFKLTKTMTSHAAGFAGETNLTALLAEAAPRKSALEELSVFKEEPNETQESSLQANNSPNNEIS